MVSYQQGWKLDRFLMMMSNISRNSAPTAETSHLLPLGGAEELSLPGYSGLFKSMLLSLGNLGAQKLCNMYVHQNTWSCFSPHTSHWHKFLLLWVLPINMGGWYIHTPIHRLTFSTLQAYFQLLLNNFFFNFNCIGVFPLCLYVWGCQIHWSWTYRQSELPCGCQE